MIGLSPKPQLLADESTSAVNDSYSRKDIKCLTALRFFPALAVVFCHARENFVCLNHIGDSVVFAHGLTFFFVLSGFMLTYNYWNLNNFKDSCYFLLARVARVWPAHIISLCLLVFLVPQVFRVRSGDWPIFLSNMFMVHAWNPSWKCFFSYNSPSWSNSTELFFYLSFPLLLLALKKHWYLPLVISGSLVAAMLSVCAFAHLPEFDPLKLSAQGLAYIHPFARMLEFSVGMMAALIWRNYVSRSNVGTAGATIAEVSTIAVVCLVGVYCMSLRDVATPILGTATWYWLQNAGVAMLGCAAVILAFATQKGLLARLLTHPFFVVLGEISFSMYMLHAVLMTYRSVNFPADQSVLTFGVYCGTLILTAHLMWQFIERPMRKLILRGGHAIFSKNNDGYVPPIIKRLDGTSKRSLFSLVFTVAEVACLAVLINFFLHGTFH